MRTPTTAGQPIATLGRHVRHHRHAQLGPAGDYISATTTFPTNTATASGTPHAVGGWQQIVASTTVDYHALGVYLVALTFTSAADSSGLVDIGTGPGGTETVVIPGIAAGYRAAGTGGTSISWTSLGKFPIYIPAGTRIAARAQSVTASRTYQLSLVGYTSSGLVGAVLPSTTVTDLGTDRTASKGQPLTVPAADNAKGAWKDIINPTVEPYRALVVGIQGNSGTNLTAASNAFDVGMGASGAEQIIVPNLFVQCGSQENIAYDPGAYLVDVPAGSRLCMRYQTTNRAATVNTFDALLQGIR